MAGPLKIELPEPRRLTKLFLVGGCVESRGAYRDHGRVKALKVRYGSDKVVSRKLADGRPYFQSIKLPGNPVETLTIEVESVYPGRKRGAPACVAELRFE
jgi:hypothetical protein